MNSCVFCKINSGKLPASWLYRDDTVMALLDIQPVNEGHTLLIPAAHRPSGNCSESVRYSGIVLILSF